MKNVTSSSEPKAAPFGRTTIEQAIENLQQALRALDLIPLTGSQLIPHPAIVARAEIRNASMYLRGAVSAAA